MTAEATSLAHPLSATLKLPNGARFYRCALQVNPFAYLARHSKSTNFDSEDDYNAKMIQTCLETGIEVIAVTDHYRVRHSASLVRTARDAGLFAFSGFEAVTKDGVHFLCLFDPDKDEDLELYIGACGIRDFDQPSPTGDLDSIQLLERSKKWGAVCIAAHVASEGGLLRKLSGQSCVNVWTNPDLLACVLPGPASDAPDGIRSILENKNAQYRRDHIIGILYASDVNETISTTVSSPMGSFRSCGTKSGDVSSSSRRITQTSPSSATPS